MKKLLSIVLILPFLCVCSDDTVGELKDEYGNITAIMPVTTDPAEIKAFVKGKDRFVIITTYQSSEILIEAMKRIEFDITIHDEAHKTAGPEGKFTADLIKDSNVKTSKRLFMTATERIYNSDVDDVISMDDESIYGIKYHELTLREAITRGILCDYEIKIVYTSDDQIRELLAENTVVHDNDKGLRDKMRSVAAAIILYKEFSAGIIHRTISYHSTIKNAKDFNATLALVAKSKKFDIPSFHMNGDMSAQERQRIIAKFVTTYNAVMTNSRTLTEGVDIPNLDSIIYVDRRNSIVDIAQSLGRAVRLDRKRPDKKAMVYLPVANEEDCVEMMRVLRDLVLVDEKVHKAVTERDEEKSKGFISVDGDESIGISYSKLFKMMSVQRVLSCVIKPSWGEVYRYIKNNNIKSLGEYRKLHEAGALPFGFVKKIWIEYPEYATSDLFKDNAHVQARTAGGKPAWSVVEAFIKANPEIKTVTIYEKWHTDKKLPAGFPFKLSKSYGDEYRNARLFQETNIANKPWPEVYAYLKEHEDEIRSISLYQHYRKNKRLPVGFPAELGKAYPEFAKSDLFGMNAEIKSSKLTKPKQKTVTEILAEMLVHCVKHKMVFDDYKTALANGELPSYFLTNNPSTIDAQFWKKVRNRIDVKPAPYKQVYEFVRQNRYSMGEYNKLITDGKLPINFPASTGAMQKQYSSEYKAKPAFGYYKADKADHSTVLRYVNEHDLTPSEYTKLWAAKKLPIGFPKFPESLFKKPIFTNKRVISRVKKQVTA